MSHPTPETEYYKLTPRAQHRDILGKAAGTNASQRGRSADRGGRVRQRAVAEVAEAQHKERERLCIFKSAGEDESAAKGSVGQHSTCSACGHAPLEENPMTPSRWPESLRQEETPQGTPNGRDLSSSVHSHRARLTQPVAPRLHTAERSASRSLSVGSRSCSEPPREFHSFAEMVTSFNERGVRYKRSGHCGTPERSVRSTCSARSARSVSSSIGRMRSTSTLTYPRGPELSTDARAEMRSSRSVSRGAGTPERSVRSTFSAPSTRQSDVPLTVPIGPVLATEKRARSRSVQSRTPSISRPERPTFAEELARSLPRVKLDGCQNKESATPFCGEKTDAVKHVTPADENTKPADENSNPTGENTKPDGEQIKPLCPKPAKEDAKPLSDASKDTARTGDDQKPQSRGPLSQLNITDYLPGDEAKEQLASRAELARLRTVSELARTQADDNERLFIFGRRKGAQSGGGDADAPVAEAA
mmetsp:Transcript_13387/g.25305  ORF Transcript_13387/g.25305 Transcript_13387/m.25305 type:complete len:475 (+) Transcript_13387:76-1500(+)